MRLSEMLSGYVTLNFMFFCFYFQILFAAMSHFALNDAWKCLFAAHEILQQWSNKVQRVQRGKFHPSKLNSTLHIFVLFFFTLAWQAFQCLW